MLLVKLQKLMQCFFITKEAKETILEFSQVAIKVWYIDFNSI